VRRRGFDHAELLARGVAQQTGVRFAALLEHATSNDQRALGRAARRANTREAFSVRVGAKVPDSVLLIDDVLTTGATLDAAARILKYAGALEVYAGILARAW
jgi:predicted amidophosphoribosyltransferase